jgi:7-cyano-7-deazaguanine synthase
MKPPAVALISGCMDSAVAAGLVRERGFAIHALSFDYGQRHKIELEAAKRVAKWLGAAEHKIVRVDLASIGGSALTGKIAVPKDRADLDDSGFIPVTYVPARNLVFLSISVAYAETIGAELISFGANAIDFSGYPDCRPEFVAAFQRAAEAGTRAGSEGRAPIVVAPLLAMDKAAIVKEGKRLGLDFGLTLSCYDPGPKGDPCLRCDSCRLRAKGFKEAGVTDPLRKRKTPGSRGAKKKK